MRLRQRPNPMRKTDSLWQHEKTAGGFGRPPYFLRAQNDAPALWAGAALMTWARRRRKRRRPAVQPKKEATRSCLRAAQTRMLHPSPHHPDLPGSLIAKPGRKLASPIISVLTLGLYENAKSHALDIVFLPRGMRR